MPSDVVAGMRERALAVSWALRDEVTAQIVVDALEAHTPADGWRQQAACRGVDPDLFYAVRGDNDTAPTAVAVCERCPVRVDCAATGLNENYGVWGGLTGHQRKQLRALASRARKGLVAAA